MNPKTSALLRAELLSDEGLRLRVYDDATGKPIGPGTLVRGNPTIAVGRNLSARGLSESECTYLLANDMAECESDLQRALPWVAKLSAGRQTVVYSLYFNVGLGNAEHFLRAWPNFLAQLETGHYEEAATNLETTEPWAREVGPRAERLAKLVRSG